MGRRNKSYSKNLHQQAYERFTKMQAFGESKKDAIANGTEANTLFNVLCMTSLGMSSNTFYLAYVCSPIFSTGS